MKIRTDKMKFCFWGSIAKGLEGKPIGGGEQQLALIAKYLNKLGNKVVIIDFDITHDAVIDGIEILSISVNNNNKPAKYWEFYKKLKQVKAQVYYARIRSSIHLIALKAAKDNHAKFVYHLASDLDSLNFKERWVGFYSKLSPMTKVIKHLIHTELLFPILLKNAHLIVTQNAQQTANLKRKGYLNVKEVKNIYESEHQKISGQQDMSNYFIYIGSLDSRKGIKEMEFIIDFNPNSYFYIIGKARDKAGHIFIDKNKTKKNVKILGYLPHKKVLGYLKGAKALINTSINEGFSNAFIEAWSLGVPVLSLNSNPSNILNEYCLGKFYNNDLIKMAGDIGNINTNEFNKAKIMEYVKKNHNPIFNTKIIYKAIKEL